MDLENEEDQTADGVSAAPFTFPPGLLDRLNMGLFPQLAEAADQADKKEPKPRRSRRAGLSALSRSPPANSTPPQPHPATNTDHTAIPQSDRLFGSRPPSSSLSAGTPPTPLPNSSLPNSSSALYYPSSTIYHSSGNIHYPSSYIYYPSNDTASPQNDGHPSSTPTNSSTPAIAYYSSDRVLISLPNPSLPDLASPLYPSYHKTDDPQSYGRFDSAAAEPTREDLQFGDPHNTTHPHRFDSAPANSSLSAHAHYLSYPSPTPLPYSSSSSLFYPPPHKTTSPKGGDRFYFTPDESMYKHPSPPTASYVPPSSAPYHAEPALLKPTSSGYAIPTKSPPSPLPPYSLAPAPKAARAHYGPVRDPPAWRLNHRIGTGACGIVFLESVHARGMESPELWAVKRIPRDLPSFTFKRYQAEIENLQALARHEWFVKFNSAYEDTHYMYIAMEYIPMGDMSQSLADGYRWSEGDTKVVIKQLLHGLAVMHKGGITHRDLKPENIFLCLPENQACILRVKIGDFGTSKRIPHSNASTYLKTTTGTQGYMAPEAHDTSLPKTNKVDIWSLGCVLYRMCAGKLLFNDPVEVLRYSWTASSSPLALDNIGFSVSCVSFLRDTLQPIPEDRPSAEDCQKKSWIMSEVPGPEYSIGMDLYARMSQINQRAPSVHSFPDMLTNRAADGSSIP